MKLQVALDYFTLQDALALMEIIHSYVDIAEIGTPLMFAEGVYAVAKIKALYPDLEVLADMKIMDGGEAISTIAYKAGADIVTVLGVTNDVTIAGVVKAAHTFGKKSFADTIGVVHLEERTRQLETLGVDYISVHTAHDLLHCVNTPIDALKVVKNNIHNSKSAISGGITPEQIHEICAIGPEIVIVGSALTTAKDPLAVAQALRAALKQAY